MKRLPLLLLYLLPCLSFAIDPIQILIIKGDKFESPFGSERGNWGTEGGYIKAKTIEESDKTQSLQLDYGAPTEKQNAGYWFAFKHFDIRPYNAIRFKVRGRAGGEMMAVGFKDDRWYEQRLSIENYIKGSITKEWQTVVVPLKDFAEVRQWDSMDNFSFSFFYNENFLVRSQVYVKDVELIDSGDAATSVQLSSKNRSAARSGKWYERNETKEAYPLPADLDNASDDVLLDTIEHAAFNYFWNEVNIKTGLIKDRCYAFGTDMRRVTSVSAVGFGLAGICVADKRGWVPHEAAMKRVLTTLKFFDTNAQMYHGFYFHYYELEDGKPVPGFEVSTIDTGIFLMGVAAVKNYYKGSDIETIAQSILNKTDWAWMTSGDKFLHHGWFANRIIPHKWMNYDEAFLCYFLGVGSPTSPIPAEAWDLIERETLVYNKQKFIPAAGENCLFEHQYPQVWVRLKGRPDKTGTDYFENSVKATEANAAWCMDSKDKFQTFAEGFWGLTACDAPHGYVVNGAPFGHCDGTVAPTAPIGSLPFTPELSMKQIRKYFTLKNKLWGKYGFVDSFNIDEEWCSSVHLGIDQGPILLMIENYRTKMIWDLLDKEPMIWNSLNKMGFKNLPPDPTPPAPKPEPPKSAVTAPENTSTNQISAPTNTATNQAPASQPAPAK